MSREHLIKFLDQLPAADRKWLLKKLADEDSQEEHDGIAEAVYGDIRKAITLKRGRDSMLSPWMSLSKSKKSAFIKAYRSASAELTDMGLSNPGKLIPSLLILWPDLEPVSIDRVILGLGDIIQLFQNQFPAYDKGAIEFLEKALGGFDMFSPPPTNPLYDYHEEDDG